MNKLSASHIAVVGFGVARQAPKSVAVWAAASLVLSIIMAGVMVKVGGEAMMQAMSLAATNPDPATTMAVYSQALPAYSLMLLLSLLFYSVLQPAAYRSVLRPRESALGYIRIGADEGRQLILNIVLSIVLFGVYVAGAVIFAILMTVGALGGAGLGAVGALIGLAAMLALFFFVAVRLSLAGPQTLAEGRLRLFESWRLTKGRFWPLFGGYFVAVLLLVVVTLLGWVIVFAASAVLGGGMDGLRAITHPDTSSFAAYFKPLTILYTVLMSVVSALGLPIILCPPAEAYREIVGAIDVDEVF